MRPLRRRCTPIVVLTSLVLLGVSPARSRAGEAPDAWAPLRFLLGAWAGTGSGKPGEAIAGASSFALELGEQVMVRRNRAEYAPRDGGAKSVVHEDLLIIYREPGQSAPRAIYFDNEGHTVHYTVTFPASQHAVVFESPASDQAPRFRLVYEPRPEGTLWVEFAIAPPGRAFKTYTTGILKRGT